MRYNGVVQRKLALLDQQVQRIEESLHDVPYSRFEGDWILRSMAERALQVAAEIVIDVSERILSIENAGPVATAGEAIESMVRLRLLSSAQPYLNIVRFRNLIVHQYEQVDAAILYDLARNRLGDFRAFRAEIDRLG